MTRGTVLVLLVALVPIGCDGGGSGTDTDGACARTSCEAQGAQCGAIPDGCGGTLDCGSCPAGLSCGGAGVANACGTGSCAPLTCAGVGAQCGALADGCGATLDCGACPIGQECGAGGTANACAPAPLPGLTIRRSDPAAECDGLLPSAVPASESASRTFSQGRDSCTAGTGTSGHVALGIAEKAGTTAYEARAISGDLLGVFRVDKVNGLVRLPNGYQGLEVVDATYLDHHTISPDGVVLRTTRIGDKGTLPYPGPMAEDPLGGSAELFRPLVENVWRLRLERFDADGLRTSPPVDVLTGDPARAASGFTVGISNRGDALVFWSEAGTPRFRWIGRDGAFVGEAFTASGTVSDAAPDRALVPLLDGSLVLRVGGEWVWRIAHASRSPEPAPAWLAAHPAHTLRFAMGNRAYALFPRGGEMIRPCEQVAVIAAPSGRICGQIVIRIGDAQCFAGAVDMGWDGAVIQQLPDDCSGGDCVCAHRWWPSLLAGP